MLPLITIQLRPDNIPLSFNQEQAWHANSLHATRHHLSETWRLNGKLDVSILSTCLQTIIQRHEVLRTVMQEQLGQVRQHIRDEKDWKLTITNASTVGQQALQTIIQHFINEPFDLAKDYLMRAQLIEISEVQYMFVVAVHPIAADGWSMSVLIKEFVELYSACEKGSLPALAPLPMQYADYAIWQRKYLQGAVLDDTLKYWENQLKDITALHLPADVSTQDVQSARATTGFFSIDKVLTGHVQLLCQQQQVSTFIGLLAAFKVLLYRYTSQLDICVATVISGRQPELTGLIGPFENILALRSGVNEDMLFTELLQQLKTTVGKAFDHQCVPFEKVVGHMAKGSKQGNNSNPLLQVMFVLRPLTAIPELNLDELRLERELHACPNEHFDINFMVTESAHGLQCSIEYNAGLYKEATINRMAIHYKQLLNSIVESPGQKIAVLPILSSEETHQLLVKFNDTEMPYPENKTIVDLFEEQASKTPDAVAVVFSQDTFTYKEINERSNQFAHYLRSKKVVPESLVPLCIERSPEMIICILGILKAGCAYVPIDPDYPAERISFIIKDTAAALAICSLESSSKLQLSKELDIVIIDKEWEAIDGQSKENYPLKIPPCNLAYIIYTSGSTGRPKGVLIEHRGLVNLVCMHRIILGMKPGMSVLQFASFCFDASCAEIFLTLATGSKLVIPHKEDLLSTDAMIGLIKKHAVDLVTLPHSYQVLIKESLKNIPILISAGEPLNVAIAKDAQSQGVKVFNGYGPTENTVCITMSDNPILPDGTVTIGKPIGNTKVYIVDKQMNIVPVGIPGELCVGGVQVARGYLNRPELTAEKFIANPFIKETGARIYKTGDMGCWLPDGNIEYLGRMDEQVKIRGYRIETGEIENVLHDCDAVQQAVVVAKNDKEGNKRLVAYIVAAQLFNKEEMVSYLRGKVPEFMIPSVWVELENFPITSNGKIDKKALPDAGISNSSLNKYEAPRNKMEASLSAIWQDLLGIERAGIRDNFFELGGHSLFAMRLVSLIRKELKIAVTANDIFIYPTIAGLVKNVLEKTSNPLLPSANIKYLVPIKTTGNKIPLYIMAGGGGTALRFKKFVELLGPGQPVYVLQPPIDSKALKGFPDTIEDIAKKFIEEIVIQNPDGPYALAGHCLGGIIAFEMAKQLEASGKKIHLLAIFDMILGEITNSEPATFRNLFGIPSAIQKSISKLIFKVNFETFLLTKHTRQSLDYKINSFRSLLKKMISGKPNQEELEYGGLEIFDEAAGIYMAACKNYKLVPYAGDMVVFYAKEHYFFLDRIKKVGYKKFELDESTKRRWMQYAGHVVIYEIEGEHSEIFDAANGKGFAYVLQQHLNKPGG